MSELTFTSKSEQKELFCYQLGSPKVTVGREDPADFIIPQTSISRSHAEIYRAGPEIFIKDLGSTNGTIVNGVLLESGQSSVLRPGDLIGFGSYLVQVSGCEIRKVSPRILVFRNTEYEGTFAIGETTEFILGGPHATITDETLAEGIPTLIIRRIAGGDLTIDPRDPAMPGYVDGCTIESVVKFDDRSILRVALYQIFCSAYEYMTPIEEEDKEPTGEMPEFLKDRIGEASWNDPLQAKKEELEAIGGLAGFGSDSYDPNADSDELSSMEVSYARGGLAADRFSRPNLETVKDQQSKTEKKHAVYGASTLVILMGMGLILLTLYGGLLL